MAYILEKSNAKHPGKCILQDGATTKEIMPILDFIKTCNASSDLLDVEKPFLSFIANAFSTIEDINQYMRTVGKLNDQFGDFFLQMKQKRVPVIIPDADYWHAEYNRITNEVDSGKRSLIDGSKDLAKRFGDSMRECININLENGKKKGLAPVVEELKKS